MSPQKEKNLCFSYSSNFYLSPQTSMFGKLPFGFLSVGRGYMKLCNAHKSNILFQENDSIWKFIWTPFGFSYKQRETIIQSIDLSFPLYQTQNLVILSNFHLADFHPEYETNNIRQRAVLFLQQHHMYIEIVFHQHYIGFEHKGAKLLPEQLNNTTLS